MASYNVTLYMNSGYNVVNTPDTPSRLASDAVTKTLPAVNIVQNRRLTSVRVACENSDAEDADYIKIGNMYYAIVDFHMESDSTCTFTIAEKPLLSVGGINGSIDILDGITSRCTVASDGWGEYTTEDPLIAPQEPLQISTEWLTPTGGATASGIVGDPIFRESTVDLTHQLVGLTGNTYTDDETQSTVTVPATVPLPYVTGVGPQQTNFNIDGISKSNGTSVYVVNDNTVSDESHLTAGATIEQGTCAIRSLGQENGSIINQWTVPTAFLGGIAITSRTGVTDIQKDADGNETSVTVGTDQVVTAINGVSGALSSSVSPDYAVVQNKRLLYGAYNKYGMITCSGNSAEYKPEDLGAETAPSVTYKSDPRPKGKPYYRFSQINGNTEFWRNALAGSEWENVPLVYQGASGSALTRLNFDNDRMIASLEKFQYDATTAYKYGRIVAEGADSVAGIISGGALLNEAQLYSQPSEKSTRARIAGRGTSLMQSGTSGLFSAISSFAETHKAKEQYAEMYDAEKARELSGLYQATDVYAPTVNFPFNADILRDVKGNGVLIYKYRMSNNDIRRCDKLLTMYGYKVAEPLTMAHFHRRTYFDYVACSTVTVTGNYPKWLLDDIADELRNGIRIWHTKPDSSAYSSNPIRS